MQSAAGRTSAKRALVERVLVASNVSHDSLGRVSRSAEEAEETRRGSGDRVICIRNCDRSRSAARRVEHRSADSQLAEWQIRRHRASGRRCLVVEVFTVVARERLMDCR